MKCIAALVLVLALVAGIAVNGSQAQTTNATSVAFEHTREGNHDVLGANAPTIPPIHQAATVIGTVAGQMIPEPVGRTPVVRVIPDIPTITGGGLENSAALPTQDDWQRQFAAGKSICPTVQELNASRQQLAREVLHSPNPTEAYKIALAKHAGDWLTRCRAQVEWATSILKQTPEGRAYMARVTAQIVERLKLECGCEQPWVVFDSGPGPGYFAPHVHFDNVHVGVSVAAALIFIEDLQRRGVLSPQQAAAASHAVKMGGAAFAIINAFGNNALETYADMNRALDRAIQYGREPEAP